MVALALSALVVTGCEESTADAEGDVTTSNGDVQRIETEFAATGDGGFVIGAEDAPVTVIEYASYTCPHCADFHEEVFPQLKEKYIDTGKVRFEFRSFPRNGPDLLASMVIACAGPEKFEAMNSLFFKRQGEWLTSSDPNNYVQEIAKRAGISGDRFRECTSNEGVRDQLFELRQEAIEDYQLAATPTIIINGEPRERAQLWDVLDEAIADELS